MRTPRVRFTVRELMVALAIVAVDLWGLISTLEAWPREVAGVGMGGGDYAIYSDGSVVLRQPLKPGSRPVLVRSASVSSRVQTWWPAGTCAGITALTMAIALGRSRRHPVTPDPPPPGSVPETSRGGWRPGRGAKRPQSPAQTG